MENQQIQIYADKWTPQEIEVIRNTVAKGTTDTELMQFLGVCRAVELNPLLKEIWCYKDGRGNVIMFAGRDGFLTVAQRDPRYKGLRSCEICENDDFSADIPNGKVNHTIKHMKRADRGVILGAYAIVYGEGLEPSVVVVNRDVYDKKTNAWATHPNEMLMKVAEIKALKKMFGIHLQAQDDYQERDGIVIPIQADKPKTEVDEWRAQLLAAFEAYKGDDKADLQAMAAEKFATGEVGYEFVLNLLAQLTEPQVVGQQELPL